MIEDICNTKILKTRYKNTSDLFASVADKIKAITEQPNKLESFIEKGACSFHNETDEGKQIYLWPEFKHLVEFLKDNIKEYLKAISISEQNVTITGMWVNKYPPGTYVNRHKHDHVQNRDQFVNRGLIIGVLYYIRKDVNAGSLVIDIPNYGEYNAKMKEGDVIIFNSYLEHWTIPNQSDNDKYTIGLEVVIGRNGVKLNEI